MSTVTCCENKVIGVKFKGVSIALCNATNNSSILQLNLGKLGCKMHLATQRNYFFSNIFHYFAKLIRTNVSTDGVENILLCACADKLRENLIFVFIKSADLKLSIRKSPRAASTELHVCFSIQHARLIKALDGLHTFRNIAAALNKNRTVTVFCQKKR